jgi:hypothetical protein
VPKLVGSKRPRSFKEPVAEQDTEKEEEKEKACIEENLEEEILNSAALSNLCKDGIDTVEVGDGKLGFLEPCILEAIKEKMQEINP